MSANAGSRLSRFGSSCLRRAPSVLAFCFAIAAVLSTGCGSPAPSEVKEIKLVGVTKEWTAELQKRHDLASKLFHEKKYVEAEPLWRDLLKDTERAIGPYHPHSLHCRTSLVAALQLQGKHAEAEKEQRLLLTALERVVKQNQVQMLFGHINLAKSLEGLSKHPEAEAEYRAALSGFERTFGTNDYGVYLSCFYLAKILADQNRPTEALPLARRAHEGLRKDFRFSRLPEKEIKELVKQLEKQHPTNQ